MSKKGNPVIKTCPHCNTQFDAREKNAGRGIKRIMSQVFCSRKCMARDRAKTHNQENHHAWKGGVFSDNGYKRVNIYLGEGKRSMPGLHRVLVEKALGYELGDLVVHHKDRNRSNNNLDNLEPLTRAEHSRHHYMEGHYFVVS